MTSEYTVEQHKAVVRVMSLKAEDYYGILLVEKTSTSSEVKRAYKKQALTMHPDKNKAPNADEAFKRVAKAFQVLSDDTKRRLFDQTGADPDSRGGLGGGPAGFGGARSPFGPRTRFAQASPADDIFAQFFGGPPMGGPQFQFQFGGDPNDIFGQLFGDALFGGRGGPRFRPAQQQQRQHGDPRAQANNNITKYLNLIVLAVVIVLPTIFSWVFDSGSSSSIPSFRFDERAPYTEERFTPKYHVPFFVRPKDVTDLSDSKLKTLDRTAENQFVSNTRAACSREYMTQQQMIQDAIGWFYTDEERYKEAKNMPLPHCEVLTNLGIRLRQ